MSAVEGRLTLDDFLLSSKPVWEVDDEDTLTKNQASWLKKYMELFPEARVVDLTQNPKKRPRKGGEIMPTLTTSCCKMFHVDARRFFTSYELAMLHGIPCSNRTAGELRVSKFQRNISNASLGNRVGNSMHLASVGLVVTAGVILTQPAPPISKRPGLPGTMTHKHNRKHES